jgi:A/G-specific adenine glycosylase
MTDASVLAFRRKLLAWGRRNRRSFPWRETDDPFRVLVAEVLLQRSRGKTVAVVYERLFARWPDAGALARARESSIASVIRPIGLVRRAATLREMAKVVVQRGGVPSTVEELLELPGVGPYAAGATAAVAFGAHEAVVDGVSARVYRRYFGLDCTTPASNDHQLWSVVGAATPRRAVEEWNWAVLDLAALVCLPGTPRCPFCPLRTSCTAATSGLVVSDPAARIR